MTAAELCGQSPIHHAVPVSTLPTHTRPSTTALEAARSRRAVWIHRPAQYSIPLTPSTRSHSALTPNRIHPLPSCSLADAHTRSTLPLPLTTLHIRPIGYCVHLSCDLDRVGKCTRSASLVCRCFLRRSRHCTKTPRPNQTSAATQSSKRLDGLPLVSRRSSRRHPQGSKSRFFVRCTRVHVGVL